MKNKKEEQKEKIILKKKDYMKSEKRRLREGKILPIYEDWKNEDKLLGYAKLNYRISDPEDELPYARAQVGEDKDDRAKEADLVIFKYQRWNITYVDPHDYDPKISQEKRWKYLSQKGFTTNWNLVYFEAVNANYIS